MVWEFLRSEDEQDYRIFRTRRDLYRKGLEDGSHSFVIMDAPDWVTVLALSSVDDLLVVRQFRHGVREETVEFPGGVIDPGEQPIDAARRELLEETGCRSSSWLELGWLYPNPPIQSNRCYYFLARDCEWAAEQDLDPGEMVQAELWSSVRWREALSNHEFQHALVVAGFFLYFSRFPEMRIPVSADQAQVSPE